MSAPALAAPLPTSDRYLIDRILSRHRVHLVGGPANVGKRTWTIQALDQWRRGLDVLGYRSYPQPFCYVSCNHPRDFHDDVLDRLDIKPADFPIVSLLDSGVEPEDLEGITALARSKIPSCELIVLAGITACVPSVRSGNDYHPVRRLFTDLMRLGRSGNFTFIGIGDSAKVKEGQEYVSTREKFLGSVAWGAMADTVVMLEFANRADADSPNRKLTLSPRNAIGEVLNYRFVDGRLVPLDEGIGDYTMDNWLNNWPSENPIEGTQIVDTGAGFNLSRASVYRWIVKACADGKLTKLKRGTYQKRKSN